jgi:hypothetical protein
MSHFQSPKHYPQIQLRIRIEIPTGTRERNLRYLKSLVMYLDFGVVRLHPIRALETDPCLRNSELHVHVLERVRELEATFR